MHNKEGVEQKLGGVLIRVAGATGLAAARKSFLKHVEKLDIDQLIQATIEEDGQSIRFRLRTPVKQALAPACDTLHLCEKLHLRSRTSPNDLEKESLLAMLLGPIASNIRAMPSLPLQYAFDGTSSELPATPRFPSTSAKPKGPRITGPIPRKTALPYC